MSVQKLPRQQRQRVASQTPPSNPTPFERVMPFPQWCKLKGFSLSTGKRLEAAGKVRTIHLSQNRKGVTESEDRRYMEACEA
jgi:hypothetical protein